MLNISNKKTLKAGFTLIELLVVVAIIGILASIVLASLNTARQRSRDARRVADIKQIQLALELYFDSCGEYPDTYSGASAACGAAGGLVPTYLQVAPLDPTSQAIYAYDNYASNARVSGCLVAGANCLFYHVGAKLEELGTNALRSDRDLETAVDLGPDGLSTLAACGAENAITAATDLCYDQTP
ncbi:MAG: hypothetical protein A3C84_00990 [Candidatus Ryanbacteria bacterium RIFCSPHIGHO2_02_FULL_48_12]|uniref:Type II secretion system protein GspG C-terminal domain-containing protein n=1 Tax=Candidatus Ryanbacteria bacterium RIFCSPHIGHO2_01_FULL_48_27 TaxID=1802115 RepID=A0A1G2G4Q9_9BACT|nr:MAG: hypothetical protein A2756_03500 [Candidatus Ryanbacteria bacterium RIFCSPHIGHO2_01_FULL_48_27]OGZ50695.1 MAG: hypothetical protein A3C84_00990 [Candidatus Ryanbacteria bacterium RIFCSPHIGHO2_02_FULL_48_12]